MNSIKLVNAVLLHGEANSWNPSLCVGFYEFSGHDSVSLLFMRTIQRGPQFAKKSSTSFESTPPPPPLVSPLEKQAKRRTFFNSRKSWRLPNEWIVCNECCADIPQKIFALSNWLNVRENHVYFLMKNTIRYNAPTTECIFIEYE